jgi:hypothetical protein
MTQTDQLKEMFRLNGYRLTLGYLLSHPSGIGYKSVSRMADLRKKGWHIIFTKGKTPSDNTYTAFTPQTDGQMRLI